MSSSGNQKDGLNEVQPGLADGGQRAAGRGRERPFSSPSLRIASLRTRLILAFVGVTVLSISSVAALSYRLIRANLTQQVGANLSKVAASNAQVIGEFMTRSLEVLETLALNQDIQEGLEAASAADTGNPDQIDAFDQEWRVADQAGDDTHPLVAGVLSHPLSKVLLVFREKFPENVEVFLTDQYGAIVAATNRTSDYNQADEGWWQSAYRDGRGGIYIGQPEFDESSKTYAVNIAVPVLGSDDAKIAGVLRTTVSIRALDDLLKMASFGQTGRVDLRVPGGQLITANAAGFTPLDPAEGAGLDNLVGGFGEVTYKGSQYMVSQAPVSAFNLQGGSAVRLQSIAQLDWTAIAYQERSEALRPVNAVVQITLVTTLVALLIVSIFGIFLAQRLAQPIVRLTEAASKVAAGDLTVRATVDSTDEIGLLASAFNAMTAQLHQTLEGLEQSVADRTRALETSTEVSRRLSTILDPSQLVKEVVEQLQAAFNYYHVHIYLFDEKHEFLVMAGGTGEAGRVLLEHGHKLPRRKGLVGRAAETNSVVLVPNVSAEAGWLPNPLLPDTRSELAVPISIGDEFVLGVLDVQQNRVEGLKADDATLVQSIASQAAIALQNARTYSRARREVEREALLSMVGEKIRSTLTVDDALKVAVRELGRATGAPQASVRLTADLAGPGGNGGAGKSKPD